jgi:hypothetical protein
MVDRHNRFKDNLAAYALDSLDSAETGELEAHLRTCKTCPVELQDYRRVTEGLLSALPPFDPPAALRRNLQKRLMATGEASTPRFRWSFNQFAVAAALTVLIGLSIFSILQVRALQEQQAELERSSSTAQTALAMLAYPGTQSITFDQNGISGSMLVERTRNLVAVFAWHLPAAPNGKTYEVWLIDSQGKRTSAGFLVPDPDYPFVTAVIKAPAPLTGFTGLGVTTEPVGGSPGPTSPKIFGADF